ncbi:MAG: SIR2 family NAD-dependent protein deacylase [Phycisphaerales bacterium]
MNPLDDAQLAHAAALLRDAHHVMVLTGAGISAESGIPTFRDPLTGLWFNYRPEDLATPDAFDRDPRKVTQWYDERRVKVLQCQPNPGHLALVELEQRLTGERAGPSPAPTRAGPSPAPAAPTTSRFHLFTQNVDRLHQRAGSRNVLELHGALESWRCTQCGLVQEEWGDLLGQYPPRCHCGGIRRPDIVWFGEPLPTRVLDAAQQALMCCDLFLAVGTSGQVYPAAGLIDQAILSNTAVIEINAEPTPFTPHVTHHFRGKAGQILPLLINAT